MFELVALTIAFSIVAHSMTDVPIATAFDVQGLAGLPAERPDKPGADTPTTPADG
jgi:hypothetical protein